MRLHRIDCTLLTMKIQKFNLLWFIAVPTLAFFVWYVFCNTKKNQDNYQTNRDNVICQSTAYDGPLSFIDASRWISEAELRSDYPMGPLLIMTLPKSQKSKERLANIAMRDSPRSSLTISPDLLDKR